MKTTIALAITLLSSPIVAFQSTPNAASIRDSSGGLGVLGKNLHVPTLLQLP